MVAQCRRGLNIFLFVCLFGCSLLVDIFFNFFFFTVFIVVVVLSECIVVQSALQFLNGHVLTAFQYYYQ